MIHLVTFIVAFYISWKLNDWKSRQDKTVQAYEKAYQKQKARLRPVDLETGEVKQDLEQVNY